MTETRIVRYLLFTVLAALCILEFVYIPLYGIRPGFSEAPPFWQQPLRVIIFHPLWLIAPALVKPVQFVLCWAFGFGLWFGFRQISGTNVLDHPTRNRIHIFIREHPGIHFREMVRDTEINRGTLSYHLAMLAQENKILTVDCGGYTRYFENNGKYSELERKVLASLADANLNRILLFMLQSPATRSELKDRLRLSGPSVMWHIHRLCDDHLVIRNENRRPARYQVSEEAARIIRNHRDLYLSSPST